MSKSLDTTALDWSKVNGLMPAIIQDSVTKNILMLGYMNIEALDKTIETGLVTFYSRTRKTLWQKGETSGNSLEVKSIKSDCDNDTLLVSAAPKGPVCHTGDDTCFAGANVAGTAWLENLENIIKNRATASTNESYTARLMQQGIKRMSQKVGEEGVEVALAATAGNGDELVEESADLIFHLTLLLVAQDKSLSDVMTCLKARHK